MERHRRSPERSPRTVAPAASGDAPRLIGRAYRSRDGWVFDPARRWRGGQRELVWRGPHAPEDGDFCIAEVPDDRPALLVEVLGADDRPEWDDHAVASQHRLRTHFPGEAIDEAEAFGEPGAEERRGREDLRRLRAMTIDPEDAQDHDDALTIQDRGDGTYEVGIHIADVSHYVRAGSALDAEARARGTSAYLPGGSIPMLPPKLSSDLCSLRPNRDRLALSVVVAVDTRGEVYDTRFAETVIRSRHRLSYTDVQRMLDEDRGDPDLLADLTALRDVARGLRRKRFAHGALALDVPEVKAWVDEHGVPVAIERRPHLESHELIEEFMLLANRRVGAEGARRASGMLFRVHDSPAPSKLEELDATLKALGLPRPSHASDPARALQTLLETPLDPARRRLLHRLVLRSLARARYAATDVGHFGLAARAYCHFTSPIRRYPDLYHHARVREWIRGARTAAWDPVAVESVAAQCTATEQQATDAEREAVKVKGLRWLEGELGERFAGTITGLNPYGFFVELDEIPVEGFVRVSLYLDDRFVLDASGVRLAGRRTRRRFSLGDSVVVTVARVDVPARECDLALEGPPSRGRRRRAGRN